MKWSIQFNNSHHLHFEYQVDANRSYVSLERLFLISLSNHQNYFLFCSEAQNFKKMDNSVTLFLVKPFRHGLWFFALCKNGLKWSKQEDLQCWFLYANIYCSSEFHLVNLILKSVCRNQNHWRNFIVPRLCQIVNELSVDEL